MAVVLTLNESGPLKRQIVEMAYAHRGVVDYEFELTPEEVTQALYLLESLMREHPWSLLGYNHATYGAGDAAEHSNIPYEALSAASYALADRLPASKGAPLTPDQRAEASRSRLLLASQLATVGSMPFANATPRGAGSRRLGPFIRESVDGA